MNAVIARRIDYECLNDNDSSVRDLVFSVRVWEVDQVGDQALSDAG